MNNERKKRNPRRRRWLRRLILTLLFLLILAALLFYGYSTLKQEYTVTYDSYTASTGSISNALSFSGNLSLIDNASYASPADADVRKIYVAPGDDVKDGDKLIRLSNGSTIEAEFDGRVNAVYVDEGDGIYAGDQLVGVGTVVGNDTEAYMCEGEVIQMHVQAGEAVQRGELLYDYAAGKKLESSAPADGIVTGILAKPGDSVQENQVLLTLAPLDGILVEIRVDESAAAQLQPGERVELGYADSIEESSTCGTIISISAIAEEELYAVRIRPDEVRPVLGMTVTVRTA